MPTFTINGTTIEVAKGGQTATASRVEIKDDAGQVIQSAASQDFRSTPTVIAQVQAIRWVHALPRIITPPAAVKEPKPKDGK